MLMRKNIKFFILGLVFLFILNSCSGITGSKLNKNVNCVMEIVINGLSADDINKGIKESLIAISKSKYSKDIVSVSAGNYGGKLGQHHFHLRKILK